MIHIRDEGEILRKGFNFYPLKSDHFGFKFYIKRGKIWQFRYSKKYGLLWIGKRDFKVWKASEK